MRKKVTGKSNVCIKLIWTKVINFFNFCSKKSVIYVDLFLGGVSLHLNHLIASQLANYDWPFGRLPFGLFWSNLDTMGLETSPRPYSGHFWHMPLFRWFKFTLKFTLKSPNSIVHEKFQLAIWDTSFWIFLVKFGHNGPWDIS